jgi:hypothetical protein
MGMPRSGSAWRVCWWEVSREVVRYRTNRMESNGFVSSFGSNGMGGRLLENFILHRNCGAVVVDDGKWGMK